MGAPCGEGRRWGSDSQGVQGLMLQRNTWGEQKRRLMTQWKTSRLVTPQVRGKASGFQLWKCHNLRGDFRKFFRIWKVLRKPVKEWFIHVFDISVTHTLPSPPSPFPQSSSFQEVVPPPIQLPRAEISIIRSTATSKQFLWPQLFNPFYFSFISHPIVIMDLPPVCVSRCSAPVFLYRDAGCKDTILYTCQFFLNKYMGLIHF